ncbi:MAG: YggS family pyridoxal phosphate-dependent enzyme [Nitrospirota bacterium]
MLQIFNNVNKIIERVESVAGSVCRNPEDIKLVAVTKGVKISEIREGIEAGIRIIGENRVQESLPKIEAIKDDISWHMIGHLQTNKVKDVIGRFELIHSVDSLNLAREIERRAKGRGIVQKILLEVNLSGEESKYGFCEEDIIEDIREISRFENIMVRGLMTIPPYSVNPEDAREYFSQLRRLFKKIREEKIDNIYMEELSMGMSNDFEVAIEEGATMVRIGTAIFGQRYYG